MSEMFAGIDRAGFAKFCNPEVRTTISYLGCLRRSICCYPSIWFGKATCLHLVSLRRLNIIKMSTQVSRKVDLPHKDAKVGLVRLLEALSAMEIKD